MLQRLVFAPDQLQEQRINLTAEQEHYLCRVLRLQRGDRFIAMNGQGQSWLARLMATDSASIPLQAEILAAISVNTELPMAITLVIALPKGNGLDEVVRQATELGVTRIAPVLSDLTLLNPSPQKVERWRRIAQEATEQSERQIIPAILDPVTFAEHLQQAPMTHSKQQVTGYLCVTRHPSPHLQDCLMGKQQRAIDTRQELLEIVLAIGPEGGWTETEIEQAIATGYQPVSLGPRILRAVTAPLVALSLIAASLEGLGSKD
ncbi:MAG: 16S rRNA (uracil(1498)-N(3))-methyltransferase [Kovacikia sp.]